MKRFGYVITQPDGLDVHPAGLLFKEVVKYKFDVVIHCGHEWMALIYRRSNGSGCPKCARRRKKAQL